MYTVTEYTLVTLNARLLRQSTIASYIQTINALDLGAMRVEDVNASVVFSRLTSVTNANSRRKHIIAIRSIFHEFAWVKQLKVPQPTPRVYDLPSEGLLRFTLALCPFEMLGLLMMYGGLRVGEACAIRSQDLRGNVLTVSRQRYDDGTLAQAKTSGCVVLPSWLSERLKAYQSQTVTPGQVRESLRRYGRKSGIHLNPHMLRHWYATNLVTHRINPEIARRQMRHSDLKTTLRYYAQVSRAEIDSVVNEFFGPDNF